MQAKSLPDLLLAVAAGGARLRDGNVADRLRQKVGQCWRGGTALRPGDFRFRRLSLGLLLQLPGKVVVSEVQLIFQATP